MLLTRFHWLYRPTYWLLCLVVSAVVFGIFLRSPGILGDYPASFYQFTNGTESRPFAYRTLVPTAIRHTVAAIPTDTQVEIEQWARTTPAVVNLFNTLQWRLEKSVAFGVASLWMYAFLLAFMWAIRYLMMSIYRAPFWLRDAIPIIAVLGLPPFFTRTNYLYDLPTLFFFTLSLALMVRRHWRLFLLVFGLACLNKETTILLTMIFVLYFYDVRRMDRSSFTRLLVSQLVIFTLIRVILMIVLQDRPGGIVSFTLGYNLRVFTGQAYALPEVMAWLFLLLLVFYQWAQKPLFLRRGLWIAVPLLGTMAFFGVVGETRVLYEVYPIVLLLVLHTVAQIWKLDLLNMTTDQELAT